jgi:anti-sigma B factor antagonist
MIETDRTGDVTVLILTEPRLDAARTLAFKDGVRRALGEGPPGRVVLDMSGVGFLDSSGLGALVAVMKALPAGRRLELAGCGPVVARVLELTRMDRIFVLHPDLDGALAGGEAAA